MGWLASFLESVFQLTFGLIKPLGDTPWMIISLAIAGGLLYWLMCQQKYNAQAEADENQLK